MPTLSAPCQITIVDFSEDKISIHKFDNDTLAPFLQKPQPKWVKCRWINVNGLSWDVIQTLGQQKNLHRLAIEDIMNTRNRTKAEWYVNFPAGDEVAISWLTFQVSDTYLHRPDASKTGPRLRGGLG